MCVHSARCRPCFFRSAALERIISAAGRDPVHCLPDLHQFITSQSVCTGRVGGGGHQNQPTFALSLHPNLLVVPACDFLKALPNLSIWSALPENSWRPAVHIAKRHRGTILQWCPCVFLHLNIPIAIPHMIGASVMRG